MTRKVFLQAAFLLFSVSALAIAADDGVFHLIAFSPKGAITAAGLPLQPRPGSAELFIPQGVPLEISGGPVLFASGGRKFLAEPGTKIITSPNGGILNLIIIAGRVILTDADGVKTTLTAGDITGLGRIGARTEAPRPTPAARTAPPSSPQEEKERIREPLERPGEVAKPAAGGLLPYKDPFTPPLSRRRSRGHWSEIRIQLHPYYSLEQTYDSNIFQVPDTGPGQPTVGGGVVDSWITTNILGLNLKVPINKKHTLNTDYTFTARSYSRQPRANNALDQRVYSVYKFSGKRFSAKASNEYINTEDPAFSELVARERHWSNTVSVDGEYKASRKLRYGANFSHSNHKYLSPTLGAILNRFEQIYGFRVGTMVRPKTKVYVSYSREIIHYSAGRLSNSKGDTADVGVQGDIAPKLHGTIEVGLRRRRFDNSVTLSTETRTWKAAVSLDYKVKSGLTVSLRAYRTMNPATFGANRSSDSSGATLTAVRRHKKWSTTVTGTMIVDKYPQSSTIGAFSANRRDDTYRASLSTEYAFRKWVKTGLSFERIQRHSIFTREFNYKSNKTTAFVRVKF